MKTKLLVCSLVAVGIFTVACRQSDEDSLEDGIQSSAQETQVESQKALRDSLATEPPKEGGHWKTTSSDSIKVIPPKNIGMLKLDSLNSSVSIIDNGPKDPPREGGHWRAR